jgi:hypothetical protein
MRTLEKDEDDTIRVVFDWSKWLGSSTIASAAWENDSGVTLASASSTTTKATNYVSGGVEDCEYWLKNTITTDDIPARVESRSVQIRVVRKLA